MTLHDLTQPLTDSVELRRLARGAGISDEQARAFVALLAETPIRQAIRICTTAKNDQARQRERMTRNGR